MKTVLLAYFVATLLILSLCASRAEAQMPTVSLTGITTLQSCPTGRGFYTSDPNHPTTCYSAQIACPNTAAINLTWSVTNPGAPQGTIVFFTCCGGEAAAAYPGEEQLFVPAYVSANYQVVQTSWATDWEITNNGSTNFEYNIRNAACRPASFLDYAYKNIYPASQFAQAGMCAQGTSAGSAQIAYSLAWYDAASFLDKAEMLVGPPLSDIKQGCQVPNNNHTTICQNGQLGCNGWAAQMPPGFSLEYTEQAAKVETWTTKPDGSDGPACANTNGSQTQHDSSWLAQSIVDLNGNFSYPHTAMAS
jgi:hypothetical protein